MVRVMAVIDRWSSWIALVETNFFVENGFHTGPCLLVQLSSVSLVINEVVGSNARSKCCTLVNLTLGLDLLHNLQSFS